MPPDSAPQNCLMQAAPLQHRPPACSKEPPAPYSTVQQRIAHSAHLALKLLASFSTASQPAMPPDTA